jgi:hypothetical protein
MYTALIISESEMERLWEQTSFAHHFDFNPFEVRYADGSDGTYPYCPHFLERKFHQDPPRYEVVPLNTEGIEECGKDDSSHLCSQAILEWVSKGLIPQTECVFVNR